MRRRSRSRERMPRQKVAARRFRFVGVGPVTLPARLGRQTLWAGDTFSCDELDWAIKSTFELVAAPALVPLPVVEPEVTTLTPAQFAGLSFKDARAYALGLYGIKGRSKAELLREYTEARG